MAKIDRYTGNLAAFGSNATGTNRTVFGDVTQSDTLDDNVNADFFSGWEIVGVNEFPTKQDFNALGFTTGQLLAYLHQMGVTEWDVSQEYHTGSVVQTSGSLYTSLVDTNTGNDPATDVAGNWAQAGMSHVASVTELRGHTPTANQHILRLAHTTAGDGGAGLFRGVPSAVPGTYVDDDGVTIVPTAGDGSTAWEWVEIGDFKLDLYGPDKTGATSSVTALKSAIATGRRRIRVSDGTYLFDSQVAAGVPLPVGLALVGDRPGDRNAPGGPLFKYTGADVCFDWREPNGVNIQGGITVTDLSFECTNVAGGMFQFNDSSVSMTDDATSPNYIMGVVFERCVFWGEGSTSATGMAIQAAGMFNSSIDAACEFRGWMRAVYLNGCDNNTLDGRYWLNGRNIQIDAVNTFGNDNVINSRWLGTNLGSTAEANYCLYDTATHTVVNGTEFQASSSASAAGVYIGGDGCRYNGCDFNFNTQPLWEVGPDAREVVIDTPYTTGSPGFPIVSAATSYDHTSPFNYHGVRVLNPSEQIIRRIGNSIRHKVAESTPGTFKPLTSVGSEYLTTNGVAQRRFVIAPSNVNPVSAGVGWGAIDGPVVDLTAYSDAAIKVRAVNNSGFVQRFVVGEGVNNGNTIRVTYRYSITSTPASGSFRYTISKNGTNVTNGALANSVPYATQVVTYTLSGFVDGDTIDIGAYNSGVTDAALKISIITVDICEAPNPDTTGLTVGNLEIEVNELKDTLRRFGLIGG